LIQSRLQYKEQTFMMRILSLLLIYISCIDANLLQRSIDKATPYSTLKLPSGIYEGRVVIDKPLSIVGMGESVVIRGDGTGSVVSIQSSDVTLQNLTITNSGDRMDNLDSGIAIDRANRVEINSCTILNTLYGIDMSIVNDSKILNNYITSKPNEIGLRGDALKVWYSSNNIIKGNTIDSSRDVTLTYAHNNHIVSNRFSHSRFGLHISSSKHNTIQSNTYEYNSVGIMVMGAEDTNIIDNQIKSSTGAAGIGVMISGVHGLRLEGNRISYNAKGIYIDSKPKEHGMQRYIIDNEISYNGEAMHFHNAIKNNTITNNRIFGNIDDIVKDVRGVLTIANSIQSNYWDRYEGFDRDRDGIGDGSHQIYQYANQLWHYNHKIKFFYATPLLSMMNFLFRVAPFMEPILLLEDSKPLMSQEPSI